MINFNIYALKVLTYIECSHELRKKLKEDILLDLNNKSELEGIANPYELMGNPKDVAYEIIDSHDLKPSYGFEYISEKELFGLPLLHFSTKKRGIACGIFAIGLKSVGIFSFGIISVGLLSAGIVSLGLILAMGSLSFSALLSLGAIAVSSYMSLGAIAISSNVAVGAIAIGKVALGVRAYGELAIFSDGGIGKTMIDVNTQKELIEPALRSVLKSEELIDIILKMYLIK